MAAIASKLSFYTFFVLKEEFRVIQVLLAYVVVVKTASSA